ncbi:MAG TPA: serine/threonine-protein kinase [Polyangiales bacterium]|nr:serine/threonine-protein kinase [Polyangiales bacterium]
MSASSERDSDGVKDSSGVIPAQDSVIRSLNGSSSGTGEVEIDSARSSLPSLPPPVARFGKYDILGRIAVGGMAEIFLAHEPLPGGALRKSALKIIKRTPSSQKDSQYFEELFLREGRTVVQLAHPNICHVYDIGREGDQFFIAMEWIEGRSLHDVIARLAALNELVPPAIAVGIAAQVASALDYAHTARDARNRSLNVVHRDVNPQNVMLRYDGSVKLVDFGVAQVSAEADSRMDTVKGKPTYMAPEQLRNEKVDARSDVFALGICLFEMLSGLRLHKRASLRETMIAVIQEPAPALTSVVPGLPVELDAIVQRALQKRPEDRYQSAGEMQAALESYLAARGEVGSTRRVGELMTRLYPRGQDATGHVDMSREATACFSAPSLRRSPLAWLRSQRRERVLLMAAGLVGLLALLAFAFRAPAPAAIATPARTAVAPEVPPSPAAVAPERAAPVAPEPVPPATASPRTKEAPVDSAPRKRRRTSPGFVADPGF